MEQIQNSLPQSTSWIQEICKKTLFGLLKQVPQGSLEIQFGETIERFGHEGSDICARVNIYDGAVFKNMLTKGSIGVAEDFIAGKWNSPDLTKVIEFFVLNQRALDAIEKKLGPLLKLGYFFKKFSQRNSVDQAKKNILAHYDLGNHLYTKFLDENMQYSSAIYPDFNASLSEAQNHKMETICERLQLQADDHVMEIGTGWGGLAIYMAQNYGCKVTTTTISDAQHEYAQDRVKSLGLEGKITLLKQDYRKLTGQYDKLVSIEMIEAVGHEYLNSFFKTCNKLLKDDGLMLIQAITIADQRYEHYRSDVDFIQMYIFPGGCLPSIERLTGHVSKYTDMVVHQINDIGLHYAQTLKDWRLRFIEAWPQLSEEGFDQQFKRLWLYYLCYCEGAFLQRAISTVHMVARKPGFVK